MRSLIIERFKYLKRTVNANSSMIFKINQQDNNTVVKLKIDIYFDSCRRALVRNKNYIDVLKYTNTLL